MRHTSRRILIVAPILAFGWAHQPASAADVKLTLWRLKTYIPPADKILDTTAQECGKRIGAEVSIRTHVFDGATVRKRFKHALTQEVAYGTISAAERRQLRGQVVAEMERLYVEPLPDRWAHAAELMLGNVGDGLRLAERAQEDTQARMKRSPDRM